MSTAALPLPLFLPPLPSPNRSLTGMVGSIKNFLSSCQRKTDFKPDDMALPGQTEACQKVVAYITECRRVLDQSLDGKNLEVVLLEFGIRIQRVIYDHVQQFVISENGVSTVWGYNHFRYALCMFEPVLQCIQTVTS